MDRRDDAQNRELPMRVDKFVLKHLNIIDDKLTLASNESDIDLADQGSIRDLTFSMCSQSVHMTETVTASDISFSIKMEKSSHS